MLAVQAAEGRIRIKRRLLDVVDVIKCAFSLVERGHAAA